MADPDGIDSLGRRIGNRGNKPGDPYNQPYVPTDADRDYVEKHVFFIGQQRTADNLGIHLATLKRHYAEEIRKAKTEFLLAGSRRLAKDALEGDGASLRFLLARRFSDMYGEKIKAEHSGEIGQPQRVDLTKFLEGKTVDEHRAILAALDLLSAAGGVDLSGGEERDPEASPRVH